MDTRDAERKFVALLAVTERAVGRHYGFKVEMYGFNSWCEGYFDVRRGLETR
ncbi:hypothetical protein [Amycolatopsis sp. YIM 10]|uniref:hypothetical protein n=1 Tax=Amycolatopsis sp. YIM 10 TaxID=2653857 RepID=UPI00129011DD|nr:hypothetical protein [Amycolatopsis sp. YIM 10]